MSPFPRTFRRKKRFLNTLLEKNQTSLNMWNFCPSISNFLSMKIYVVDKSVICNPVFWLADLVPKFSSHTARNDQYRRMLINWQSFNKFAIEYNMRGRSFPFVYCVNRNHELAVSVTIMFTENCARPRPPNLTRVHIENFQAKKFP